MTKRAFPCAFIASRKTDSIGGRGSEVFKEQKRETKINKITSCIQP